MNQEENRRQVAFPIAAWFCVVGVVLSVISRPINGYSYNLFSIVSYLINIALAVVLFMRKRDVPLFAMAGVKAAWCVYTMCSNLSHWIGRRSAAFVLQKAFFNFLPVLFWAILILFAVVRDRRDNSPAANVFKKIWFVPGILKALTILSDYSGILSILSWLVYTIEIFLLGYWIMFPYGKENHARPQPYMQAGYQAANGGYQTENSAAAGGYQNADRAPQRVFCTGCGTEFAPDAQFCSVCGRPRPVQSAQPVYQQNGYQQGYRPQNVEQDAPSTAMKVLGFFLPGVGLILYLVWKDQLPLKAKSAGKGALIGVIVWAVLCVLLTILPLAMLYI